MNMARNDIEEFLKIQDAINSVYLQIAPMKDNVATGDLGYVRMKSTVDKFEQLWKDGYFTDETLVVNIAEKAYLAGWDARLHEEEDKE